MRISNVLLMLTAATLLFTFNAKSQTNSLQSKVDTYIGAYVKNGDFSGNVLIAKGKKILFAKSYGKANYELNVPMQMDIKFRIASLSKTFTAAAIELLQKKGLLNYADKLSKYIPDFTGGDSIEIIDLLLHRSGIADIDYDRYALDQLQLKDVIDSLKNKPLYFKPGSQSRYSNSGYLVLAYTIEKVSGETYTEFLSKNIFKPLALKNTGVDKTGIIIQNKATGYSIGEGANGIAQAVWYDINLETGSGSLYSTTGDLLKWLQAIHMNAGFATTSLPYPFGWGLREYFKGHKSIEQSGFLNGYSSYMSIFPSDSLYIVALSNISSNFNEQSGRDIAAIYFNQNYSIPAIRKNVLMNNLNEYTGKYSWPGYKDFFIEKKGNTIYWRFADEKNGSPLTPVSNDMFLLRLTNNKITFEKDATNKVTELNFFSGQDKTTCKKVSNL